MHAFRVVLFRSFGRYFYVDMRAPSLSSLSLVPFAWWKHRSEMPTCKRSIPVENPPYGKLYMAFECGARFSVNSIFELDKT